MDVNTSSKSFRSKISTLSSKISFEALLSSFLKTFPKTLDFDTSKMVLHNLGKTVIDSTISLHCWIEPNLHTYSTTASIFMRTLNQGRNFIPESTESPSIMSSGGGGNENLLGGGGGKS